MQTEGLRCPRICEEAQILEVQPTGTSRFQADTNARVITAFIAIGVVFIPIRVASLDASQQVVEILDRYDSNCVPTTYGGSPVNYIQDDNTNKGLHLKLGLSQVPKQMKAPVYVYYQLTNFCQNHRRYMKSRSEEQLRSKSEEGTTSNCDPEEVAADKQTIVPCGLIAWSLFNDTYRFSVDIKAIEVNKKDISWKSDREHKFGFDVYPKKFKSGSLVGRAKLNESVLLSQQEDLIVWMRTTSLPTFSKLDGRIEEDLEANKRITVIIENNCYTYNCGGKKRLVLSTKIWMGGKNEFLGVGYLTIGGLSLFLAISFILVYVFKPRPLGDPSYLSWN